MNFYREASLEDFQKKEKEFYFIPEEIKKQIIIKKDVDAKIVSEYRKMTGFSLQEGKRDCGRYLAFYKAFGDFRCGKIVYTDY